MAGEHGKMLKLHLDTDCCCKYFKLEGKMLCDNNSVTTDFIRTSAIEYEISILTI